jgi:hypothetical protein
LRRTSIASAALAPPPSASLALRRQIAASLGVLLAGSVRAIRAESAFSRVPAIVRHSAAAHSGIGQVALRLRPTILYHHCALVRRSALAMRIGTTVLHDHGRPSSAPLRSSALATWIGPTILQ